MKTLILTLILSLSTLYSVFSQEREITFYVESGWIINHAFDDTSKIRLDCYSHDERCFFTLSLPQGSYFYVNRDNHRKVAEFIVTNTGILITYINEEEGTIFRTIKEE